jgi:PncC family amidohydrolase
MTTTNLTKALSASNGSLLVKAGKLAKILKDRGKTISVAESLTGGLISTALTSIPGSSSYFLAGLTAYSNEAKMDILKVSPEVIVNFGAVSPECARAMAFEIRSLTGSNLALSSTGIAGPDGGSPLKPVGLFYVAIVGEYGLEQYRVLEKKIKGSRAEITLAAAESALDLTLDYLKESEDFFNLS